MKKTWNEKLNDSKDMPRVKEATLNAAIRYGGLKMLLTPPRSYDFLMREIPFGRLTTVEHIREYLAERHNANFTCPATAGVFVNIVANASAERSGANPTPYWRTLKKGGELCGKYPGGIDAHKALLEAEGHTVIQRGKRYFVADYESKLFDLNKE